MEIVWYAADGYVGKDRPHVLKIDLNDFAGLNRDEVEKLLCEMMDDEFREKITWELRDHDATVDEIAAAARNLK